MSLNLSHCVPEDAPELAKAYVATYQPISPRYQTTYRNSPRETMLKIWEADFLKTVESQSQPSPTQQVHCLKVTDSSNGEIMAYAIWKYLPQGYKPEDDGQVVIEEIPDGANERLLRDFCKITGKIRSEHPGRREEHWLLLLLGTVPKYERRGAGALLIRWPFTQADRDGKRCYVDASPVGYSLYKRCGFSEDVGEMSLDLSKYEPDSGLGTMKWVAMVREPQSA